MSLPHEVIPLSLEGLVQEHLRKGEKPLGSVNGAFGEALVVTRSRALICKEPISGETLECWEMPLGGMEGVQMIASDRGGALQFFSDSSPETRQINFGAEDFEKFEQIEAALQTLIAEAKAGGRERETGKATGREGLPPLPSHLAPPPAAACPSCGEALEDEFIYCPHCGERQRASCESCGAALKEGWRFCPVCGRHQTG